jgi:hypothetical protein
MQFTTFMEALHNKLAHMLITTQISIYQPYSHTIGHRMWLNLLDDFWPQDYKGNYTTICNRSYLLTDSMSHTKYEYEVKCVLHPIIRCNARGCYVDLVLDIIQAV